jgi:hypothetical protein
MIKSPFPETDMNSEAGHIRQLMGGPRVTYDLDKHNEIESRPADIINLSGLSSPAKPKKTLGFHFKKGATYFFHKRDPLTIIDRPATEDDYLKYPAEYQSYLGLFNSLKG